MAIVLTKDWHNYLQPCAYSQIEAMAIPFTNATPTPDILLKSPYSTSCCLATSEC